MKRAERRVGGGGGERVVVSGSWRIARRPERRQKDELEWHEGLAGGLLRSASLHRLYVHVLSVYVYLRRD